MSVILICCVFVISYVFARYFSRWAILSVPAMLPLYVLRLNVGLFHTTILELLLLGIFVGVSTKNPLIWYNGWNKIKPWHKPIFAWTIATIVAVMVAPNHFAALGLWRAYILEPLLYLVLVAATLKTTKDREHLIRALISSVVVVAGWAVFQFTTGLGIPHPWDTVITVRRATGPFPFPNALALFCAPIAALCLTQLRATSSHPPVTRGKAIYLIGFIAATLATLLAKSVGGSLAILSCVAIIFLWNKRTRLPVILCSMLIVGIVASIPAIRKPTIQTLSFQGWSGKVRLIIWKETTAMLKEHPIFGAGFGAYPDVIKPYHTATYIEIFQFPHNILLNLWSETGLLGIAAFIWICVVWIRLAKRKASETANLQIPILYTLPLVAMLTHGLVDVPYFKNDLAMLFWILAALTTISVQDKNRMNN